MREVTNLKYKLKYFLAFILFFFISSSIVAQDNKASSLYDNIYSLRELANNQKLDDSSRVVAAREAIKLSELTNRDSTLLKSNRILSYLFLVLGETDSLYRINHKNLKLATRLRDTLKMAYAYENLAYHFYEKTKPDSSYFYYYKARKFYDYKNNKRNVAAVLLNMANIQESEGDFIGSEINSIKGIEILKQIPKNDDVHDLLWSMYNNIGIASGELNRYDKAIEYHTKAKSYSNKIKGDYQSNLFSQVNIAIVYKRKGDYKEAVRRFLKILEDKTIRDKEASTYGSLLSNLAMCKSFDESNSYEEIDSLFRESLKVLSKVGKKDVDMMFAYEQFSEFFLKKGEKDSAQHYVDKAYDLSLELGEIRTTLNALIIKSKIDEGEDSKKHLFEHIKRSDSLLLRERLIRNKFARIDFETDEILQENEEMSRQLLLLIVGSAILLITGFFFYLLKVQKEKNNELLFAQKQQEANAEIYNLMLSQQDRIDEVRSLEKKRISEELHDGILGRLFGARLSLDSLNMSIAPDAIESRGGYINELKCIEQDIRKVSHDLNTDFIANSGFVDIINTLVETQSLAYNLKYTVNVSEDINWDSIANTTKIHFYRIIQESLHNIYKHANATEVSIVFIEKNNIIFLNIEDNGSGFQVDKAKRGIGLKNISSRVNDISGVLGIESIINKGTLIKIEIPN